MSRKTRTALIMAGGTGGHVFPAFSLAKYFAEKNILTEIRYETKKGRRGGNYN